MASLAPICRTVSFVADGLNLASEITRISEARTASRLEQASLYTTITGLGCKLLEFVGLSYGASPQQLHAIKSGECLVKVINLPLSLFKALERRVSGLEIVEQGVIVPLSDLTRVCSEAGVYKEQTYIEAVEKDPTATRTYVKSCNGEGDISYGQRPIDPAECKQMIEGYQKAVVVGTAAKVLGDLGAISKTKYLGSCSKARHPKIRSYLELLGWFKNFF